ncbi:hypothetical protein [Thalassobacillus hwangdonensis]|uniref:Uncharacterized protein n=1 Tax=Thalassobacillus hwangdonensis TaxID=546108 RepID=A0ABW3L2V3_9BACI
MTCKQSYQDLQHRLKQQEQTIAQLVEIVAATNKRVFELDRRQSGVEHLLLTQEAKVAYRSSPLARL